jgi:carbonic anhydrase
MAAETKVDYTR